MVESQFLSLHYDILKSLETDHDALLIIENFLKEKEEILRSFRAAQRQTTEEKKIIHCPSPSSEREEPSPRRLSLNRNDCVSKSQAVSVLKSLLQRNSENAHSFYETKARPYEPLLRLAQEKVNELKEEPDHKISDDNLHHKVRVEMWELLLADLEQTIRF